MIKMSYVLTCEKFKTKWWTNYPRILAHKLAGASQCVILNHWSPTVPVSAWLSEPARDRGSKQETLNDDFYHTTYRSAAIFGVQGGLSYLVLVLTMLIGLCPMKRSGGVWSFRDVSVTYRRSFGNHTLAGALCSGNILPEPALVSQQFRCFTEHSLIISNI